MDTNTKIAPFLPLSRVRAQLGESPVWSEVHGAIWWVDISGRALLRTDLNGATQKWPTPEIPGFIQCIGTEIFVGMQTGIFKFSPHTATFKRCVELALQNQRFNDACTDTQGRIWAGTMDIGNANDSGVLFLFDPAKNTLTPKLQGFRTINGLAWDDTRKRLMFSDSHPSIQTVWTSSLDENEQLLPRSFFVDFSKLLGRPDGAALDKNGHYWIAGVGGALLYQFTTIGKLIAQYQVPVQSPTKPAFIGDASGAMVLTSFADIANGGLLGIWRPPPTAPVQESHTQ